ncbi:molybdate ABC transporter substrate-binding protein [Clostridium botulinum]|nr:molybdate ABC transporter substrate-binding protein [Clostridium botulinum]
MTFDASGTIQKQIEQGAPTDLFISASKKNMDKLQEEKLIDNDTRKDLLGNKLVLIVSEENKDKKLKSI